MRPAGRGRTRAETERLRREYEQDIDILRLAAKLVVDDIVEPEDLRGELERRFAARITRHRLLHAD
jgi:propionyl-CoA carboxylase beta subunit